MTPNLVFYLLITLIIIDFIWDWILDYLNAQHFNDLIPDTLNGIFNEEEYVKSQQYKLANYKTSKCQSLLLLGITLVFFFFSGFAWLDNLVRQITVNSILISLLYIGILGLATTIISIPFDYYDTFYIEEKFGFNKSTKAVFWMDKLKGLLLSIVLGGLILYAVLWFYENTQDRFWWYTWLLITSFTLLMTFLYSNIIVPLFNKQTALEDGELKTAIQNYAEKNQFKIDQIFVIDGSKRSTKANAYFTGFGAKKRIVLYDTLIHELSTEEIVAVLAHEVGHYQKKHVIINMIISILMTGFTLWLLSKFINSPTLASALGVAQPSFHIGMIVFGILYSPISEITGLLMNELSRKFEYQADHFAKTTYSATHLVAALKKLSKQSLSNLTPHNWYVYWHYSHPTLLQRINRLMN